MRLDSGRIFFIMKTPYLPPLVVNEVNFDSGFFGVFGSGLC